MDARIIAEALGGCTPERNGYKCLCPVHGDRNPSLAVWDNPNGTIGFKCRSQNCSYKSIVEKVKELVPGAKDFFSKRRKFMHLTEVPNYVEHYPYTDKFAVVRTTDPKRKTLPMTRDGIYWVSKRPKASNLPLYRHEHYDPDKPILIVEGEKTANKAAELFSDYSVITWVGGTGNVANVNWDLVIEHVKQGGDVIIWPDNDDPGRMAAEKIAAILGGVRIVPVPPDLPKGWDLADKIPDDLKPEKLIAASVTHDGPLLDLPMQGKNGPLKMQANADYIFDVDPKLVDRLRLNTFTGYVDIISALPGDPLVTREYPGQFDMDVDLGTIHRYINQRYGIQFSNDMLKMAIAQVARKNQYSPVVDWLDSLEWDGDGRLRVALTEHAGATGGELEQEFFFRWMISAVARAMQPGCKADHMLVLEGEQGIGKSTLLNTLTGDEWFSDGLPVKLSDKDAKDHLQGKWIIELQELAALTNRWAEVEAIKAFLTTREDKFRRAYTATEKQWKRQCVFAGTTNDAEYLKDATGNRRFWPVRLGKIDLEWFTENRDQLWAEAVYHYKNGDQWHLPRHLEEQATAAQQDRVFEDEWFFRVKEHTEKLPLGAQIRPGELAQELFAIPAERLRGPAMRMAKLLKELGWEMKKSHGMRLYERGLHAKIATPGGPPDRDQRGKIEPFPLERRLNSDEPPF